MQFKAELDTASIAEIVRLQGFGALLDPGIRNALVEGGTRIAKQAQDNARSVFIQNSPGGLADNIYPWLASPSEMQIIVDKDYGQRREKGFSGLTDALGRFYPYDPAKPYLIPAMESEGHGVEALFDAAVNNALGRVAV